MSDKGWGWVWIGLAVSLLMAGVACGLAIRFAMLLALKGAL